MDTLNSKAAMSMSDTGFSSQCPWGILDTGAAWELLYALFPCPEHAVCRHQPQCDALPRACVFVTWHISIVIIMFDFTWRIATWN